MASCFSLSCFPGWFSKTARNVHIPQQCSDTYAAPQRGRRSRQRCVYRRHGLERDFGTPNRTKRGTTPVRSSRCERLKTLFSGKRPLEAAGPLPEPCTIYQLPAGVFKHWAPQSRCCEDVLEEIRLNGVEDGLNVPETNREQPTAVEGNRERLPQRLRRLLVKERTPEELEIEALRKERKAIIKYLKWVGLYDRRMTYEHMKSLKTVVEQSLESEKQKEEIEMKEIKTTNNPTPSSAASARENHKSEQADAATVEPQPKPEPGIQNQLAVNRPEGPLEETDGTMLHPGTGLAVSPPIKLPGKSSLWRLPLPPVPIVKDNMLLHILPGDVPCIQCNREVVLAQQLEADETLSEEDAPSLPAKQNVPRVVDFVLKPGVALHDLNYAVEVDSRTQDGQDETNGTQNDVNPIPKPFRNLRWNFGP